MRSAFAVCAVTLPMFLVGCGPAISVRPLYTAAERATPGIEPRIEGEWIVPNIDKEGTDEAIGWTGTVAAADIQEPGGHYTVEMRPGKQDDDGGNKTLAFELRLVPIGERLFFDARLPPAEEEQEAGMALWGLMPLHLIGRLWVNQDFLRFAVLDAEWAAKNLPESFGQKSSDPDPPAIFTGSTPVLRDLVSRNADNPKAFAHDVYLCRPRADCALRGVEDMLARQRNDGKTLEKAAGFFLERGQYARAAALGRHRVELNPKDYESQAGLGRLLLFSGDFEAARSAFDTAAQLDPKNTYVRAHTHAGIIWSYFLERKFVEAAAAAASNIAPAKNASIDSISILLGYLSLVHLSDRAKAESWLKDQLPTFSGSAEAHLLLLSAAGRVGGPDGRCRTEPPPVTETERGKCLTEAIRSFADGDAKKAIPLLEQTLEQKPNNSLMALAARIELENLRAGAKK